MAGDEFSKHGIFEKIGYLLQKVTSFKISVKLVIDFNGVKETIQESPPAEVYCIVSFDSCT
jgi:hypothetical protein